MTPEDIRPEHWLDLANEPQPIYLPLQSQEAPRVEILAESLARLANGLSGLDGWRDGWSYGEDLEEFRWPSENWMTMAAGCALFAGDSWAPSWWRRYWRSAKATRGLMGKEPASRIYVMWGVCPSIMAAIKLGDDVGLDWSRAALAWLTLQAGWGRGRNHGVIDTKLWEGRSWTGTGARSYSTQHGPPIFLDCHPMDCLLGRLAGVKTPTWDGWGGAGPAWADWLSRRSFGLDDDSEETLGMMMLAGSPGFLPEDAARFLGGWKISQSWQIMTARYSGGILTWVVRGPAIGNQGTDKLAARWWRASDGQTGSEPALADGVRIGDPEIRAIHSPRGEPIGWTTPDGRRFDWKAPDLGQLEWRLLASGRGFELVAGDAPPQHPPAPPATPPKSGLELNPEMREHLRAISVLVGGHEPRPGWDADGATQALEHAHAMAREVGRQRGWKQ